MVEVFSAAAPRAMAMAMLLMVDTKFVPLLLHPLCIVVAVEEYLGNALLCQIELLSVVVSVVCLFEKNSFMIMKKKKKNEKKKRKKRERKRKEKKTKTH